MAVGLSAVNLANKWLDLLRGVAFTPPTGLYVALHKGDPGAAGTANPSTGNATRVALVLGSASNSVAGTSTVVLAGTQPSWLMAANETISHISVWNAATAGTFLWSAQLTASRAINTGDTFTLTACGLTLSPVAV
jgi:hypothetical protein